MPGTTDGSSGNEPGARWRRVAWFILLYAAGLAVTLVIAYGLKALVPGV